MAKNLFRRGKAKTIWADFTVGGRRYRRSLRTDDAGKARAKLKALKAQIREQAWHGERRDWQAACVKWGGHLAASVKPATLKRYTVSLNQLEPYFKGVEIADIDKARVGEYVSDRQIETTNATIRRDLTALSQLLDHCEALGWREGNPALFWGKRLKEAPYIIHIPTDGDVQEMLRRGAEHFRACVRFLAETGVRAEEAVTLERPQIDFTRSEVRLLKTKNSRPRVIKIRPSTSDMLAALPRYGDSRFVFWHGKGEAYANFSSRFAALNCGSSEQRDLDFRCHDLRHRYAVMELRGGRDIYDLSRHLGHSSVKVTERYLGYIAQEEVRKERAWHAAKETA